MLWKIFIAVLFLSMTTFSQTPPIEPGVSQALAKWRAANYSDVRYRLNLTLEKGAPLMKGEIEISVKLTETGAKNDLILDWRTTQFQNDKDKPYADVRAVNQVKFDSVGSGGRTENEHLIISSKYLKTGENVVKIQFTSPIKASGAAVTRYVDKEDGAEYVYSLFVPSDASTAFPVFDQPDLKAKFTLNLIVPKEWKAISNTDGLGLTNGETATQTAFSFTETQPISTYVFAFAAGNFGMFEDSSTKKSKNEEFEIFRTTFQPRIYVRKSQAEKFKQHAAEVFRLNREGVKFLESYFDYKFPFPKYDLVLIPEFPFGGMEHAGATFLREASIIFPSEPTKNDYISRANLIFHEAAHQWFGDTVTMKWFDDLWLKEGFATFVGYKALEKIMPQYNAWKIFYERNKQSAYQTDSTRGTTPIYQEIPNLSAAKSAYGAIVYSKAPSFLRQAEFYLGEDKFQTAVRTFLKKHEYANAEWTDLVKEFETSSKLDLKDWANTWVTKRGLSILSIKEMPMLSEPVGRGRLAFRSQQNALQEENLWQQKTRLLIIRNDEKREIQDLTFFNNKSGLLGGLKRDDKFVFPNYQDYGYGIFLLDEKSRDYVLKNIGAEKDDFLRSMMWGALWDSVREGELDPAVYVELAYKNLLNETDESTIQAILSRVSTAMNYYLSDKQRLELAPKVESLALGGMFRAKTTGQKITFFRAFLNLASSDDARRMLTKILKSDGKPVEMEIFGSIVGKLPTLEMPLKTKDKFDIVTRLLILENKRILGKSEAEELLAELEKTETSDDAKRYAYAARAGIGKAENKAKYWNDFVNNKEISESWIESAFAPFNSIRHAELTLPYLEKALAELPNLKRNRKIFFVNGWLGAFIGGQKSREALEIVNKFLADNPNLDKDLRLKILENVDVIERAVKIREKYGK